MTWKQALLRTIKRWENICNGEGAESCMLCIRDIRGCKCPLGLVGMGCGAGSLYNNTSRSLGMPEGIDGDFEMYFFLCMLYHEYYG